MFQTLMSDFQILIGLFSNSYDLDYIPTHCIKLTGSVVLTCNVGEPPKLLIFRQ